MGWLDKLLGREKEPEVPAASSSGPAAPPAPQAPAAESPAERGETGAETARDDAVETENRLPPGSG